LAILLARVVSEGMAWINLDFLTGKLSTQADRAGIMGAILGTFWLMVVVGPVSMFLGVGTAIYLELYLKKGKVQSLIQTNITNLAGVPRSEEHTSELQSRFDLVCRLLLEKKKKEEN